MRRFLLVVAVISISVLILELYTKLEKVCGRNNTVSNLVENENINLYFIPNSTRNSGNVCAYLPRLHKR